jgi:hypothetical protein
LIDAALKRAQEQAGTTPAAKAEKKQKAAKAEKEPKEKATATEKPAKAEKVVKEKAEKSRAPTHLSKVEKASANLPALSDKAARALKGFDDEGGFSAGEFTAIAAHLSHKARLMMTAGAATAKLTKGDLVEILPGDRGSEKYVGFKGRLTEVRSIRCFADILGPDGETVVKKNLYLFTSGVKVIAEELADEQSDAGEELEAEATNEEPKEFPADSDAEATNEEPKEEDGTLVLNQAAPEEQDTDEEVDEATGTEG